MIRINPTTFARAIEKAATVRPACQLIETDEINYTFHVARSGDGFALVDLWFKGGAMWSSCDCFAGTGADGRRCPLPCYHVAAAALSVGLLAAAPVIGAVADPRPERAAAKQIPAPLFDVAELAPETKPAMPAPVAISLVGYLRKAARAMAGRLWLSTRIGRV